jgi:hypothetical protein
MSNTPPQDAPASNAPGNPNDPWNLRRILDALPPPLQQLFTQPLTDIMHTCRSACSDSVESANAVTRDLERLLQCLVSAVDAELQSNSQSDIRTSGESWHLLGRLVDGINRHFEIRPRIIFVSEDADMQSAAAAARGIKGCFTRLIELLSSEEDHEANVAALTIYLMDTDGDAETSMRFAFLDIISRRVVAVKRPSQRWHVTIDGEVVRHSCRWDDASQLLSANTTLRTWSALFAAFLCLRKRATAAWCCLHGSSNALPLWTSVTEPQQATASRTSRATAVRKSILLSTNELHVLIAATTFRSTSAWTLQLLYSTKFTKTGAFSGRLRPNVDFPPSMCSLSFLWKLPSATSFRLLFCKVALMLMQASLLWPCAAGVYPTPFWPCPRLELLHGSKS